MAMLSGAPRTANVVSEEETEILEVTDTVLRELATKYPQIVNSLKNFYRQRLLNNVMAISPLFKDFDPSQRKALVEKFRMRQAAPGEKVIAEGKTSDGLYVVLHGVVDVTVEQRQVARLKEGEIFGEMSLLTRDPASATVTAKSNAILLRLPATASRSWWSPTPDLGAGQRPRRDAKEGRRRGPGEPGRGQNSMSFQAEASHQPQSAQSARGLGGVITSPAAAAEFPHRSGLAPTNPKKRVFSRVRFRLGVLGG